MSQFFKVLRKAIEKRDCHKLRISLALSLCIAGFFAVLKLAIPTYQQIYQTTKTCDI